MYIYIYIYIYMMSTYHFNFMRIITIVKHHTRVEVDLPTIPVRNHRIIIVVFFVFGYKIGQISHEYIFSQWYILDDTYKFQLNLSIYCYHYLINRQFPPYIHPIVLFHLFQLGLSSVYNLLVKQRYEQRRDVFECVRVVLVGH